MKETSGVVNNCSFKAKLVKGASGKLGVLHILDTMGSTPCRSVTNSVDWLVPNLMQYFGLQTIPTVVLYGTDSLVSLFNLGNGVFTFVDDNFPLVNKVYCNEMHKLYGRRR